MNPNHLIQAQVELSQLQKEGRIEPIQSLWACEAFYVNKHAEQARGK